MFSVMMCLNLNLTTRVMQWDASGKLKETPQIVLTTEGSNLLRILGNVEHVNPRETTSNSIIEIFEVWLSL